MNIMDFSIEEINLIAIYKTESKEKTIVRLNNVYPYIDAEMKEIADSSIRKLRKMTKAEYELTLFIPATPVE